jgi:glyoxylase-like metal-dependent hydrolase (beta-lactamase superfamily II)
MKDIKLIVVTHAHVDHAGSAARLRNCRARPSWRIKTTPISTVGKCRPAGILP